MSRLVFVDTWGWLALGHRADANHEAVISFTDLTSMSIMTELDIREVLTGDEHFLHVGMGFQRIP